MALCLLLSLCVLICFPQTRPCSMSECWNICPDKQHNAAECVRNRPHLDPPITGRFRSLVTVAGPVTSAMNSSVNHTCGSVSSSSDAFRCTSSIPCAPEWNPVHVAAHLHLLGEALSLIGLHLKGTNVSKILFLFVCFLNFFFLRVFFGNMFKLSYWLWCTFVISAI